MAPREDTTAIGPPSGRSRDEIAPGFAASQAISTSSGSVSWLNLGTELRTCTDITACCGPLPSRSGDLPVRLELGPTGALKRRSDPWQPGLRRLPHGRVTGCCEACSGQGTRGGPMSKARRLAEIPAGSWTKWLVMGFWVAVFAVAFPLSVKLS